jgi:large subunit ribosomal protein L17
MRHRAAGKHLGRTASHRKAMRRNLAASLLEHGAVRTTLPKASDVRRFVERLITIARRGTLHARRQVIALLGDRNMVDKENLEELAEQTVVQKLFDEIAPRYADRTGGYTRIIHLPERRIGDAGRQVLLQLVEQSPAAGGSRRRRRAARRAEAARSTAAQDKQTPDQQAEPAGQTEADQSGEETEAAEQAKPEPESEQDKQKDPK